MIEVMLQPNLSHCIETVAKREYERVLGQLMKSGEEDSQLEQRLELLRLFLESADFGTLRSRCDELLLKGKQIEVKLKAIAEPPEYEIEIEEVIR